MRKRQDLDGRISGIVRLEQAIADNTELIEMGELEGDQSIVAEAEKALVKLKGNVAERELDVLPREPGARGQECARLLAEGVARIREPPRGRHQGTYPVFREHDVSLP